jgi:hypothetical protein
MRIVHRDLSGWQRAEERKGPTFHPDWHWIDRRHPKALRINVQAIRETRACEMCGKKFVPVRADAKTCGSRCRQRAYRIRNAEVQR